MYTKMLFTDGIISVNEDNSTKPSLPSDYISKPKISENGTIPSDILDLNHSYGYRCKMKCNLSVIGGKALIYIAGNIITFIDIQNKTMKFRRSAMGRGIGFICSNTVSSHFAVGENGSSPPIIVYEWPSLKASAILRNGTAKAFTYLSFRGVDPFLQAVVPASAVGLFNYKESSNITAVLHLFPSSILFMVLTLSFSFNTLIK